MKKKIYIKKRGFSLLEVLIMLMVVSFTMISAMSLVAKANISIKNNETLELVNGIMFKSVELFKSPSPVYLSPDGYNQVVPITAPVNTNQYFTLQEAAGTKYLSYITTPSAPITTCDSTSIYRYNVTLVAVASAYYFCLQVIIQKNPIGVTGRYFYTITTNTVYSLNGSTTRDTLITYRYDTFIPRP